MEKYSSTISFMPLTLWIELNLKLWLRCFRKWFLSNIPEIKKYKIDYEVNYRLEII